MSMVLALVSSGWWIRSFIAHDSVSFPIACVFMGGWIRSQSKFDVFGYGGKVKLIRIASLDNQLSVSWLTPAPIEGMAWNSGDTKEVQLQRGGKDFWDGFDVAWRWDFIGFHFGSGTLQGNSGSISEVYSSPYWSITIPMTLMAAWLLFSKPQKANQKKIIEPIAEKVA